MSGPRPVEQQLATAHTAAPSHRSHRAKLPPSIAHAAPQVAPVRAPREEPRAIPARLQLFIQALIAHDDDAVARYSQALAADGTTAEQFYEEFVGPAARILGEMWCTDDCSFYDVTVGTGRLHRLVRDWSPAFLRDLVIPGAAGRIALGCCSNEQHSLGVALLAEYFIRDGWDVQLCQAIGSDGLLDNVRENGYNLLGFSVSVTDHLGKLQADIRRVRQVSRNRDIKVLVGGALISADPSLVKRIGADGYAHDASSAVREARRLLLA